MKKSLIVTLVLVFVLGIAGTAFAANPFVDVPAKHWSYEAVAKLAQAGIIDGYGDGTFKGDKTITRYEMAQIVAKAMAKEDRANAEQKALINKLAAEYKAELDNLGVRVSNLENKVDNVKWGGEFRERYDNFKQDNATRNTNNSQSYVDMWATAQINPDWVGKVEYESSKQLNIGGTNQDYSGNTYTTRVYVQGKLMGTQATFGKFDPFAGYGIVMDDNMTGAQFKFGNVLQTRVGYGKYSGGIDNAGISGSTGYSFATAPTYAFGEMDLALSKATNVKVAYHNLSKLDAAATTALGKDSFHITEAGFDTKLAQDWALMATASKSSLNVAGQDNKGYFTQVTYKAADVKKEGSFDIFANYRKVPVYSQLDSTWDYARGVKGFQVGFDYVPAQNIKANVFYLDGKNLISNTDQPNVKVYRAQVEFFF